LVVGYRRGDRGRREGFTLHRPFGRNFELPAFGQHLAEPLAGSRAASCGSKLLLLFRATLVSEPMGVYQRQILLRVIRRLGEGMSST
jgi:hypothetical protein